MSALACIDLLEFMESISARTDQPSHHFQRVVQVQNIRLCHVDVGV